MLSRMKSFVRKFGYKKGINCLFHIDHEPRAIGEVIEPELEGWFLSEKGQGVALYLSVDGNSLLPVPLDKPRLDIYKLFPGISGSLLSGFSVNLPYELLVRVGANRLSLVAHLDNKTETVWTWNPPIPVEEDIQDRDISALVTELNKKRTSVFNRGVSPAAMAESLLVAINIGGQFGYLREKLTWLNEQINSYKSRTDVALKNVGIIAVVGEPEYAAEVSDMLNSMFVFENNESNTLTSVSLRLVIARTQFPGWWTVIEKCPEAFQNGHVFYCHDNVQLDCLSLSELHNDYVRSGLATLLMPAPYGGPGGLEVRPSCKLIDLRRQSSVQGSDIPALFPVEKVGPVWISSVQFLLEVERHLPQAVGLSESSVGLPVLPPDGLVPYYCDLRHPLQLPAAASQSAIPWLSDAELQDMADVFTQYIQVSAVPGSSGQLVYFLLSPRWNGEGIRSSYGFQEYVLVEELERQGCNVLLVATAPDQASLRPGGRPVLLLDEIMRTLGLENMGIVLATHWSNIPAAFSLSYLTGSPVFHYIQELGDREYLLRGREHLEPVLWSYRGNFVPIFNSESVAQTLSGECDGYQERIVLPPAINHRFFARFPKSKDANSILWLTDTHTLGNKERLRQLQNAFQRIFASSPEAKITLFPVDGETVPESLRRYGEDSFSKEISVVCPQGVDALVELYVSQQIVVDGTVFRGAGIQVLEAAACGAIPVVGGDVASDGNIEHGKNGFVCAGDDVFSLADGLRELLSDSSRLRLLAEGVYSLSSNLARAFPEGLAKILAQRFEAYKDRLTQERSRRNLITIVLPVYGALDATSFCLRRLVMFLPENVNVIIVDDCSDQGTHQWLKEFCSNDSRFTLLRSMQNQGFVQSCIQGFLAVDEDRDIILLNSDVFLAEGSLRALQDAAYSRYNVALASSLSTFSPNLRVTLNQGDSLDSAERKIRAMSQRRNPTVITAEGQFLYIRRYALQKFGFLDEAFGRGYGEESDMCMRMFLHGLDMVCADNSLILHRHAASFGTVEKKRLISQNRFIFEARWARYYYPLYKAFLSRDPLGEIRNCYATLNPKIEEPKVALTAEVISDDFVKNFSISRSNRVRQRVLDGVEVVFILPSVVLGGGTLSVLQHVDELLMRGVSARVISLQKTDITDRPYLAPAITMSYEDVLELDWSNQKVVATFWTTAYLTKAINGRFPNTIGYYYIQDYEPWFYSRPDDFHAVRRAEQSYELGLIGVAKTKYPVELVKSNHGVDVHLINPGIDQTIFYAGEQDKHRGRVRLVAMYRPETARRGTKELRELFHILVRRLPELKISVFGSELPVAGEDVENAIPPCVENLGRLKQTEVASLYRQSDIVVDLSYWHGFGRTGLEAMACGVVPVLSTSGGVDRYALDGQNCFLVDGLQVQTVADRIILLAKDRTRRLHLRKEAIQTGLQFSESVAVDDWQALWNSLECGQVSNPKIGSNSF